MDDSKVTHKEKAENLIAHFGSIDVKKMKAEADFSDKKYKFEDLMDSGSIPPIYQDNLNVGFFNANTFAKGIANLGYQCIADYLIRRDINVHFAFADTIKGKSHFINSPALNAKDCDLIAFSIPFEDTYLDVLRMLDAVEIPIFSKDRGDNIPLILAGGMAMINPIPLSNFVDIFVIGEGRSVLMQILDLLHKERDKPNYSKENFVRLVAHLPGVGQVQKVL